MNLRPDPPALVWPSAHGLVVAGHGVASGHAPDARFPHGTLALQIPCFAARGLDLSAFHQGTINLDTSPWTFEPCTPRVTFRAVRWHDAEPPEDFSFFDCRVAHRDLEVRGLLYRPHPDTKPDHFQPPTVVELLLPWLADVGPGTRLTVRIDPSQGTFRHA
jgi:hypothetical protein